MPTLLKGLHICYVPTTADIDMCYKNIEEMKLNGVSAQNEVKILFNLILFFIKCFNHQDSKISYIALYGGVFFFHFMPVFQGLVSEESDIKYIWETKTCDRPFWFSCMKADLTFSQNSQLTIFTAKYGGDPFDYVPLLCTLCALSMFFEISCL